MVRSRKGRVLAIDDESAFLENWRLCTEAAGHGFTGAQSVEAGIAALRRSSFDVCLLDRSIGDQSGLEALPQLLAMDPGMRVIMVSAHDDVASAMSALDAGAHDYLAKPCSPQQLLIAISRQLEARALSVRLSALEQVAADEADVPGLHSASPTMQSVLDTAREVAATDANVLILGESGTGKGVLARAIHGWSSRAEAGFVTINSPSLGAELLESELFGHLKGSFTGAVQTTTGRVQQADGGTLFLDEIGDFPLVLQPKLLRFIQDREYERVGEAVTRMADVRIVAATNRDLDAMTRAGSFRQDLLYRLNVISLTLPPLRERPEDVDALALGFLARFAQSHRRPARGFSPAAMALLRSHAWPGNVRELQNVIERATILCRGEEIQPADFGPITGSAPASEAASLIGGAISLAEIERLHIERVLETAKTLDSAAQILGIDASTLYRKRKAYGLI